MSNARIIRRPAAAIAGRAAGEKRSGGKSKWIAAALILLLLAIAAWAFLPGADPALARIEQLRSQLDDAPPEKRRELFGQMRDAFENLRPESRDQMRDQWRQRWDSREQKFLNDFFALTPAEQIAKLDEQIDDEEHRRQERAQRRSQGGDRQARGGGRGDRGGRGGDRNSLERRKGYLDSTAPQTRAQRGEYRRLREERRAQRGLPASQRWW